MAFKGNWRARCVHRHVLHVPRAPRRMAPAEYEHDAVELWMLFDAIRRKDWLLVGCARRRDTCRQRTRQRCARLRPGGSQ